MADKPSNDESMPTYDPNVFRETETFEELVAMFAACLTPAARAEYDKRFTMSFSPWEIVLLRALLAEASEATRVKSAMNLGCSCELCISRIAIPLAGFVRELDVIESKHGNVTNHINQIRDLERIRDERAQIRESLDTPKGRKH